MAEEKELSLAQGLKIIRRQMISWSVEYRQQSATTAQLFAEEGRFENCQEAARCCAIAQFLEKTSPRITAAMVEKWLENQREKFGVKE